MSAAHSYLVKWFDARVCRDLETKVRAYSAQDALFQITFKLNPRWFTIHSIEPDEKEGT